MTIKRRLFISNILMLIMPIILTLFISSFLLFIFMGVTGTRDMQSLRSGDLFYRVIGDVDSLAEKWLNNNDFSIISSDIDLFNKQHQLGGVTLSVFKESELLYPKTEVSNSVPEMALTQEGTYTLIVDNTAVYRISSGEYTVILLDNNFMNNYKKGIGEYFNKGIIFFFFIIVIIILINRFLTRFVFRSIMTPLDTLINGVHQIRDGNLSYRIGYDRKDEFAVVCSDFNEMAQQLSDMVNARQKDETNRRELIAGISHDLRTPLTSIKAYVEGIEKGVASTPQAQRRYFDTIKNKVADLEYIINQLFLFSKLDIGEFPFRLEQIDIGKELKYTINSLVNEYENKGLFVSLIQSTENVYVKIDVVQFRNVIHNILENSLKYKNEEYAVTKITCREAGTDVVITLSDNGPGVPQDALEKLFDVFYRNDSSRKDPNKGSGLGLAITAKIIERLDGRIEAENVAKGGLAIVITLPIYKRGEKIEKNIDY